MYQQISSLLFTKKSLFNSERNLKLEIETEFENNNSLNTLTSTTSTTSISSISSNKYNNEEDDNFNLIYSDNYNSFSPPLSRNNSCSSSFSPLNRIDLTRSRNNSFVSNFNLPSSRPTSGRFNLNSIFFAETPTGLSRTSSFDLFQAKLKRSLSINRDIETPSPDLHPNSRLYRDFQNIEPIVTGDFGTVYKAQGILDNVPYAIKKLGQKCETEEEKARIIEEVQALALISDKNDAMRYIVRYYNSWFEDDYLLIQMELCDNSVAESYEPLEPQLCYRLLRDILNAFVILHSHNFVHLDVKPANILRKKDHFKLADFGLALHRTRGQLQRNIEPIDTRYMARELLSNNVVEDLSKCDIFSLGMTVYGLCTFYLLESEGELWEQLRSGLLSFPDTIETSLMNMITSMTSPDPTNRPTAKKLIESNIELMTENEVQLYQQLQKIKMLEQQLKMYENERMIKKM